MNLDFSGYKIHLVFYPVDIAFLLISPAFRHHPLLSLSAQANFAWMTTSSSKLG